MFIKKSFCVNILAWRQSGNPKESFEKSSWTSEIFFVNRQTVLKIKAVAVNSKRFQGGRAIVFCAAGVSRSAALALAYLVKSEGMSLKDAYHHLNQRRPIVSPNVGFWRQLIDFEKEINGDSTVQLITGRMARPVPDVYLHRTLKT